MLNETKVGILALAAIVMAVMGYNFIKGQRLSKNSHTLYAEFDQTIGLPNSSAPVLYKGLQIGTTGEKTALDERVSKIIVPILVNKKILIPKDAVAVIGGNALGLSSSVIEILPGSNNNQFLQPGDTLRSVTKDSPLAELFKQLTPDLKNLLNRLLEELKNKPAGNPATVPPVKP